MSYETAVNMYLTTCQISHSRFLGFLALQAAFLVGVFTVSGPQQLAVVCVVGFTMTMLALLSSVKDHMYVRKRFELALVEEERVCRDKGALNAWKQYRNQQGFADFFLSNLDYLLWATIGLFWLLFALLGVETNTF